MSTVKSLATHAIQKVDPKLKTKFLTIVEFLDLEPSLRPALKGGATLAFGSATYLARLAEAFVEGRVPNEPKPPSTVPDELVSVVLNSYFNIPKGDLGRIKREHQLSMSSEGIVGDLLERYIASVIELHSWVWCSGEVVKSVDFIKAPINRSDVWVALQVKNRDNSENSSSSAIRRGTSIKKWYRTKSRTGATMWPVFPDSIAAKSLSEEGLQKFASEYLKDLRKNH